MSARQYSTQRFGSPEALRGVMSDDEIAALQARNEERQRQAREALGSRWLCFSQVERKSQ